MVPGAGAPASAVASEAGAGAGAAVGADPGADPGANPGPNAGAGAGATANQSNRTCQQLKTEAAVVRPSSGLAPRPQQHEGCKQLPVDLISLYWRCLS